MRIARSTNHNAALRIQLRERKLTMVRILAVLLFVLFVASIAFDLGENHLDMLVVAGTSLVLAAIGFCIFIYIDDQLLGVYAEYNDVLEVNEASRGHDGTYDHYFTGKSGKVAPKK